MRVSPHNTSDFKLVHAQLCIEDGKWGFAPQVHLGTPFFLIFYVLKSSPDCIGSLPEVPRLKV